MGLHLKDKINSLTPQLSEADRESFLKQFQRIDCDRKGYISLNDLRRHMKVGVSISLSLTC